MLKKLLFTGMLFVAVSVQAFAKTGQTISFTQVTNKTVSSPSFTLSAVAQSNLPVTFTIISGGRIASLSGSTVTLAGDSAGSVTIQASQAGNASFSAAPNVNMTFVVSKNTNTVTLGSIPTKYVGTGTTTFALTASATTGTEVFSSSNTAVATVNSSGTVHIVGVGTSTIKVSVAASSTYAVGLATQTLIVNKNINTVTLAAIPNQVIGTGGSTYTVSALATYPTILYSSSNTAVATINSSGVITMIGAGSTIITASVPATALNAAGSASQTLTVSKNTTIVTLAAIPVKYIGTSTSPFSVSASANYGTLRYASSDTNVAKINSSGSVTIVAAGSALITASVLAGTNYTSASASQTLTVDKNPTTVTLAAIPVKYIGVSTSPFLVSATTNHGTITYSSSDSGVAKINSSGSVTIIASGTTIIKASVAAGTTYTSGSASQTLTVDKSTNTVTFSSIPTKYLGAGGVTFTISASATSGTLTYASSNTAIATVNPSTGLVTLLSAGTTYITASVLATTTTAGASASQLLTVDKNINTVTLPTMAARSIGTGGSTFSEIATATYPTVAYSSSNASVATINSAGLVTLVGPGSTNITASVAATSLNAAGSATQTLTINKNTTIVTLASIPTKYVDSAAFSVSASTNYGTITYSSSDTDVATINSAGLVTIKGAGGTIIKAIVATGATYTAGVASQQLSVNKDITTLTLATIPAKLMNAGPFSVVASSNNGTITYSSSDTNVAKINSSGIVTLKGSGSTIIKASVVASATYAAASASQTLIVTKVSQTITWGGSLGAETTTSSPFSVTATASSALTTVITVQSGPATISSGIVTLTGVAGTVVLSATQSGNGIYSSVTSTKSISVTAPPMFMGAVEIDRNGAEVHKRPTFTSTNVTDGDITVYPNPTKGIINVTASGTIETMAIYSITGQQVMKVDNQMASMPVDMSGLPKGVYFVRITLNGSDNQIVKRVVIE